MPPLEVVRALSPRLLRGSGLWQRAQALGARYHFLLTNVWGHPPREEQARGRGSGEAGAQQEPCIPSLNNWKNIGPPYENFDCFREAIRRFITGFRDEQGEDIPVDGSFIFDLWNEPNSQTFWVGTEAQLFETFAVAVETVRSLLPGAWIAAPSTGLYDREFLRRLLDYAAANDVRFEVLSWHELLWPPTPNEQGTNISAVQEHLQEARRLFLENPDCAEVGLREIHINEYVGPPTSTGPANWWPTCRPWNSAARTPQRTPAGPPPTARRTASTTPWTAWWSPAPGARDPSGGPTRSTRRGCRAAWPAAARIPSSCRWPPCPRTRMPSLCSWATRGASRGPTCRRGPFAWS
ncbi:MAG: hypothetical protein Q9O62_08465 [Ardenticatenia bacterium]|nr:hypothetical protein [Ardenticatenia bacterium]